MPWAKGQSGNPNGRKALQPELAPAIRAVLRRKVSSTDSRTNKQAVAEALVSLAIAGDVQAIRTVLERVDGKVPEPVQLTGDQGGPLVFTLNLGDTGGDSDTE